MIKKTSWLYVVLNPYRWKEVVPYLNAKLPKMGAGDCPDPRDLDASEWIKGVSVKLPFKLNRLEIPYNLGWKPEKQSRNSCTAYSKCYGVEIINTTEDDKPAYINKELQWKHQEETGASRDRGDFIQNAEKQFHNNPQGFPQTEYRRMRNKEDSTNGVRKWLSMGIGRNIRTGIYWKWINQLAMTNSTYMKENGFFIPGEGEILGGHAVLIIGFDDKKVCPNGDVGAYHLIEPSLGQWGDNKPGEFWCSYKYHDRLFSKYISRDAINKNPNE